MASTILYPNADGTLTNWTASAGNKWDCIDEGTASPNDADYIQCSTQNDSGFVQLTDTPSNLLAVTAVTIKLRTTTGSKGDFLHWNSCQIVGNNESAALTSSVTMTDGLGPVTYSYTPSTINATDKASWDGARLKFTTGSGTSSFVAIYAAQVEITYTVSSGGVYTPSIMMSF